MFDRFTERARKVMTLARMESKDLNHDYIGTGHILIALAKEGSGVAAQVIKSLDMDVQRLRAELERMEKPGKSLPSAPQFPFSPRVQRLFGLALEEAENLGEKFVGTEHLLLGLIRESDGPAARILRNLGVEPERVRETTVELLGTDPPGPEQEQSRALVETMLLKRLRHAEAAKGIAGPIELEVRSAHGLKGWGFQLWMGHRSPGGDLRTELAFWASQAPTLEEHFAAVLELFTRLMRSESKPPAPPAAP